MAHALRVALKNRAIETTHSYSLELIAKAFGYDNWNILSAKIEAAKPSLWLQVQYRRLARQIWARRKRSIARSAARANTTCAS
jgi:hypothetical protein